MLHTQLPNIVVIAAGGGNDIFSAIAYIKAHLHQHSFEKIALIGLLGFTPFHSNSELHPTNINIEHPIIIPSESMHRYLSFHKWDGDSRNIETIQEIYANERLLPTILANICPEVKHYLCLSPKYSAIEQSVNITRHLIELGFNPENTTLNIVDFGGDILTNGNQSSIISPDLDAYTLSLVSNMPYKSILSVCFPGVDGELPHDYLTECCSKSISQEPINKDLWRLYLNKLYNYIRDYRPGNTIPNMLKILDTSSEIVSKITVKKSWHINGKKLILTKEMEINPALQSMVYFFTLPIDNPFTVVFSSKDYDLYMVMKHIMSIYNGQEIKDAVQSSDLHLQYLRKDIYGKWTNKHILLDGSQEVMLVNVIPNGLNHESIPIFHNKSAQYDTLYLQ